MHFVPIKIGHALILYYAKRHVLQFCSTCLLLFLILSMPSVLTSISSHPLRWPPSTSFFPSKYGISSLGTIQRLGGIDSLVRCDCDSMRFLQRVREPRPAIRAEFSVIRHLGTAVLTIHHIHLPSGNLFTRQRKFTR